MNFLDRRLFLKSSALLLTGSTAPAVWGSEAEQPPFASSPSFEPMALFLTWQSDPCTTMTVQWIGKQSEGELRPLWYRPRGSKQWQSQKFTARPYPQTEWTVFRTEITGLKPDTEYRFRVGLDSPQETFRTMPATATDTIQFVSGGDSGTGSAAESTNRLAAVQAPRFVMLGGDLAYENGRDAERFLQFLRNYSRDLRDDQKRLIPLLGCLGNHEVNGSYEKTRAEAPFFYSVFEGLFPETGYATLDFGDYLSLVILDSHHTTPIPGEQTDWLEQTLKTREDFPNVFVYYHVPAYPSYRSFEGDVSQLVRQHWVPLFERYNVDAVMEHHDHTFKRSHPLLDGLVNANGIPYLGDGSWGKIRPISQAKKQPYLARVEESYHLSVHRLEGPDRYHVALSDTGRIVDLYSTRKRSRRRSKG